MFKGIIGHESLKEAASASIDAGKFAHAHILAGEDGIGKSLIANAIGLKILGKTVDRQYADLLHFSPEKGKKSIGIRYVTDEIMAEINMASFEGDKKVIVIHKAHLMTSDAQNAFLKTIEEPPQGVYILLLCEKLESVLETIKSRCQIHKLQRLSDKELEEFLNKKHKFMTPSELKAVVSFSEGIPGKAERFLDDVSFKQIRSTTLKLLMDIGDKSPREFVKHEKFLTDNKEVWQEVLTWILSYTRDAMVYGETGDEKYVVNSDKLEDIKNLSSMLSFARLDKITQIINETRLKLERNVNTSLSFSDMLLKFLECKEG